MAAPIEDYALIGDTHTAGLVSREGSIDWLCMPRFDSPACFAALLGDEGNGRWLLRPAGETKRTSRRYREGTLVLETEFETDEGSVRIVDCMPPRDRAVTLVRLVEGLQGRVPMRMELIVRLDYGSAIPWVTKADGGLLMVQGPDALRLCTPVDTRGEDMTTIAEFSVGEGERVPFLFDWHASHEDAPEPEDPTEALDRTMKFWQEWCERCTYEGEWRDAVLESLIVLKALTHEPTGGTVAAPT